MNKWIFRFTVAVSLLFALFVAAIWLLGVGKGRALFERPWSPALGVYHRIVTIHGQIRFDTTYNLHSEIHRDMPPVLRETAAWSLLVIDQRSSEEADFYDGTVFSRYRMTRVSCWPMLLIALALPSFALLRRITRRRQPAGLCPTCHYDLRHLAGMAGDKCPECGTPIASESKVHP